MNYQWIWYFFIIIDYFYVWKQTAFRKTDLISFRKIRTRTDCTIARHNAKDNSAFNLQILDYLWLGLLSLKSQICDDSIRFLITNKQ